MKNPASSRPDSSASAVVDHGILDLGTSVKVNDDLRRSLETEMQLIDENTTKLKKQITNEHAISNELSKTKSRANKEVAGLRQGAIEGVESITMNERVFGGLQKTFRTELRDSTNSQDAMMDGATNDKENKQQENLPPSIPFIKKTQKNNDIEASRIYGGIENQSKIVHAFVNKKKEIREDVKSVLAVMETDQLESRLTKEKQNTKAAEETIGVELKRSATIKSNLATLKARNAEMKKQIEEMVENQLEEQKAFADEEAELDQKNAAAEEEFRREEKNLVDLKAELSKSTAQVEAVKGRNKQMEALIAAREAKKEELSKLRAERNALFSEKTKLETNMSAAKASLDSDSRLLVKLEANAKDVADLKTENDKLQAAKIEPGHAELPELEEEQKKVVSFVEEKSKESEELKKEAKEVERMRKELTEVEKEAAEKAEELEGKQSVTKERRRILQEHKEAAKKKSNAAEKISSKTEAEIATVESHIADMQAEEKSRQEAVDMAMQEIWHKHKVLDLGIKMLRKGAEKERKASME